MFQIDLRSRKAIYAQIIDNFKRLIITGALRPDDKISSIRELAQSITVNPNTVQKAYRELENQGYIYTVLGQGNFVAMPEEKDKTEISPEVRLLYEKLKATIQELMFRGQDVDDICDFVSQNARPNSSGGAK